MPEPGIQLVIIAKEAKVEDYNEKAKNAGIGIPTLGDAMTTALWDEALDTEVDGNTHQVCSWSDLSADERDKLIDIATSLGPANNPGPQNQASFYDFSEEESEPPTVSTQPIGGHTPTSIFDDLLRKPGRLKPREKPI